MIAPSLALRSEDHSVGHDTFDLFTVKQLTLPQKTKNADIIDFYYGTCGSRSRGCSTSSQLSSDSCSDYSELSESGTGASETGTGKLLHRSRSCLFKVLEEQGCVENSHNGKPPVAATTSSKSQNGQKSPHRHSHSEQCHVEFKNCRHCHLLFPSAECQSEGWKISFCSGECHLTFLSSSYDCRKR